ncbi:SpoIID/LytB domain-containing protein [Bacillus sp. Marseille-P3661]|uniref:SpoIID/LytB domain-containing protein n=1 Tax=Bacillus sp. Marseille-P3661 TaxID=1936234 RepID=UPI000C836E5C|nr:SpoIID/LytB domain-containing protein [Bacillus sp. Marseille-P3661]
MIKRLHIISILGLITLTLLIVVIYPKFIENQFEENPTAPFLNINNGTFSPSYPLINVKLLNYLGNVKELIFTITGQYQLNERVLNENNEYKIQLNNGQLALYENKFLLDEGTSLVLRPIEYNYETKISINNMPYLGVIQFIAEGTSIRPINTLPIEDYLKGVIPHEMPASWDLDALKAQTVAARTFALSHQGKIIDDSTNYQVYSGYAWHPNATRAVNETNGQILKYNGDLVLTVFSSSNGGITETNENVWGGNALPYLPVKVDPYDPVSPWSFSVDQTQIDITGFDLHNPEQWWNDVKERNPDIANNIKNWLQKNGYPNSEIKLIAIPALSFAEQRTTGKRVQKGDITLQFALRHTITNEFIRNKDNSLQIHEVKLENTTAQRIRSMLGLSLIKSYLIDSVDYNGKSYVISGRGFGHGAGMSQWGAKQMADKGKSYQDILLHYYPGTTLTSLENSSESNLEPVETTQEVLLNIGNKLAVVNGTTFSLLEAPFIKNNRTLIPLRFISEQLGANVHWDPLRRTITITDQNRLLVLKDRSKDLTVNGKLVQMDVAPEIVNGTTFVPIRFVIEQLNGNVVWDPVERTVFVKRKVVIKQRY